jgi:hypothetical protein
MKAGKIDIGNVEKRRIYEDLVGVRAESIDICG